MYKNNNNSNIWKKNKKTQKHNNYIGVILELRNKMGPIYDKQIFFLIGNFYLTGEKDTKIGKKKGVVD